MGERNLKRLDLTGQPDGLPDELVGGSVGGLAGVPDEPADGLPDESADGLAAEVDALRVRLDDQAAMLKRTHAAVTSLAESLGKVVASQRRRERGINLNSFVAYTLFTLLLGGGFFLLYSTRAGALVEARDAAVKSRDATRARVHALEDEIAARDTAQAAALEYYQLLRDNRHTEVIARYPEIERLRLTPTEVALFAAGVEKAKSGIVDAGYLAGLDAYRAGNIDKAANEFRTALAYEDTGPRAAQMRYYLGLALYRKSDFEGAVRQLELALAGRVEQSGGAEVRFYLAAALEKLGELEQARTEYDRFASAYSKSPLAVTARRRAAQLSRKAVRTN